jgi:site-specific DNA-methyltransferase (adenine-specific)/adenine-specific DNA-methyltransferase
MIRELQDMPTLNWIGKEAVVKHHKDVPYRLLEPVAKLSCGDTNSGNLIVQGDNLHALKALLPRYAGQVKCIYIDPPYNTGNEGWIYNDNVNSPEIRKWLGELVGKEGETLDRHDRWLCMLYPRLSLLKQFLREDGVIFVSIDDNEVATLRLLMDEVFGAGNFLAHIAVKANPRGRQAQSGIAIVHDHLLAFARSLPKVQLDGFPVDTTYSAQFKNKDADGKFWRELGLRQRGAESRREDRPDMFFPIYVNPKSGRVALEKTVDFSEEVLPRKSDNSDGRWAWNSAKVARDNHLVYGRTVKRNAGLAYDIFYRDYLERDNGRTIKAPTIFDYADVNTEQGGLAVKEILGEKVFAYPKPVGLIQRILQIGSDKNSLILDSFGGSGTTAHAVLKQNAEDGGNRRFILVEMDNNIAHNVTSERVRRVAQGFTNSKDQAVVGLGGSFQFCKLSEEPLYTAQGQISASVTFAQLAEFVWFVETGTGFMGDAGSSPLLGTHEGRAIYLLYNGILKDKSVGGGNVLTSPVLDILPPHDGVKVIYATACRLGAARLAREQIVFKQTPYALEV